MDPGLAALIGALSGLVTAGVGAGGWFLAKRRLATVEEPAARAGVDKVRADAAQVTALTDPSVQQLNAETEKLHAEARTAEVQAVLNALEGVSKLWEGGQERIGRQSVQLETLQGAVYEVQDQLARFQRAWDRASEMLAHHEPWDHRAASTSRQVDPEFPDPPPLTLERVEPIPRHRVTPPPSTP